MKRSGLIRLLPVEIERRCIKGYKGYSVNNGK